MHMTVCEKATIELPVATVRQAVADWLRRTRGFAVDVAHVAVEDRPGGAVAVVEMDCHPVE